MGGIFVSHKKPILEVPEGASIKDIEKAYKKLALIHHPDKGGNPENFKQLLNEYELSVIENQKESVPAPASAPVNKHDPRLFSTNNANHKKIEVINKDKVEKEEKIVEITKMKYHLEFAHHSSNKDRISLIFAIAQNNKFSAAKEPLDIYSGSKKIAQLSFLGRFVEQTKITVPKVMQKSNVKQEFQKQQIKPASEPERPRLQM